MHIIEFLSVIITTLPRIRWKVFDVVSLDLAWMGLRERGREGEEWEEEAVSCRLFCVTRGLQKERERSIATCFLPFPELNIQE